MSNHTPFLIIISAPSGCGKTTILNMLSNEVDDFSFSVSHTTRPIRIGETAGIDYHFIDNDKFIQMKTEGDFIEYAQVHTNYYGTSFASVERQLEVGLDVILDIDVQGMLRIRGDARYDIVTIFILPPNLEELELRLRKRNTDSDSVVLTRIKNAAMEIKFAPEYDYNVVNDNLNRAVANVAAIIKAERLRSSRLKY